MFERLIKKFIIWYFLKHRQEAVFKISDKFVVRIFTIDYYNNDVTEALRAYQMKKELQ